ncbi:uncharacterized protein LOC754317 [Strongylocentrotus purpuratus]|uniref:Helitron helicase-like domain-containing protein n=1 Tax=Strongylocentrotus purpuratus TaxID=7668 RepID=A0A7M7PI07_STRPU|nr:uncharacterized protein LOC754317 [Strongylocentrotus purpuratus]|eukprot:XP_001185162.2 PREDICTED: uncharacterized protein LOC754317 [Strongylocentrotus purpuratus]
MPKRCRSLHFSPSKKKKQPSRSNHIASQEAAPEDEGSGPSTEPIHHANHVASQEAAPEDEGFGPSTEPIHHANHVASQEAAPEDEGSGPSTERIHEAGPEILHIGPMSKICPYCDAMRFPNESLNCCHDGKICLPELLPYPNALATLLQGDSSQSKHFRYNIRYYNSSFAFASMGAMMAPPPGRGPYCFRIHGQIYHRSGCLHPPPGEPPKYGQVYILEGNLATSTRIQQHPQCNQSTMETIQHIIEETSPYAAAYKCMKQVEDEQMQTSDPQTPVPSVKMIFKRGSDQRRYNLPTVDEVAAVFVGEDGMPPDQRDFAVYPKNHHLHNISCLSANIDPMTYPLLFPRGDLGWMPNMLHRPEKRTKKRINVTFLQFYSFRLAVRQSFSAIHRGGKLFQQYIVDAYVKTEANRLQYVKNNQKQLRVAKYQGLMDHLHKEADHANLPLGKVVVLPSTFHGSPRCMQQNYQDAMAIVAKYGKPDLFLTFTCNPKWDEIKENLLPGQTSSDRPDIVARVFKQKLNNLLADLRQHHVLGRPIAWIYVIEFQKRGLPHCHMLLMLSEDTKMRNPEDIDNLISAQIPDPDEDSVLYNIIKATMVHGPCGTLNPKSVCMDDGKCQKDFPKNFQAETQVSSDGYPLYARPDNGRTLTIKNAELDNRWIVPYSPYLSRKYQAHINLEACMSVKSVKYLFKYVYKGHDCASVEVQPETTFNHDEVSHFLNTRYVSAPEAMWRLSEYKMHAQSHTVHRLPVHLEDQQNVYFTQGNEESALERAQSHKTQLTAWFELNASEPEANQFLYVDIAQHYVWDMTKKKMEEKTKKN